MPLDIQLFHFINSFSGFSPISDWAIIFFASYVPVLLVLVFLVLIYRSAYTYREKLGILVEAAASVAIARLAVPNLIYLFYQRPRPFLIEHIQPLFRVDQWSFPSGHASFLFALATTIYLFNRRWGIIFFIFSVVICISRISAGVHYPSDILGGAVIGVVTALLVAYLARSFLQNSRK